MDRSPAPAGGFAITFAVLDLRPGWVLLSILDLVPQLATEECYQKEASKMPTRYQLEVTTAVCTSDYDGVIASSLEQLERCMPREVLSFSVLQETVELTAIPVDDEQLFISLFTMVDNLEHAAGA